ncbi:succinylglutamate desuccinylase/aspartoacylase family protein [Aureliella helgolandensis]|uniref:Succinylglutamate desuccinylase / Aspartoacylase family protein n=1 Tax=Aureliella helgolandensis TaxID=2527968 RepID=A0A518G0I1_9BACT|nr:succinylglutamate desuccinylase/aspartoacylase family protein [Aureliella helgolandensis]QDV22117.1 Succinylglutamate desuccinylase / Aspartoacylase family protein [Aureliella helgolandensis]
MPRASRFGKKKSIATWDEGDIAPGETRNFRLTVSESYSGMNVRIPIQVRRAKREGPTVFVTAALHGDEINGTGVIRQMIHDGALDLKCGGLILVPVLNLLAFDRHSRYLPDRRDLNRCFPGSLGGSLASRMARRIFDEIVMRSDYGIDLHTAAVRRTNYPNIRADMGNAEVARIAHAFGSELVLNGKGPKGSFRREATSIGCPTIVMEGGEVWKVEPRIVESAMKGVTNVLRELGMLEGETEIPPQQTVLEKTVWLRAERGGFLQFHVAPGEVVVREQAIATNTNLLGVERSVLYAPFDGVVIGMTTLPAVTPGEPVCHLGRLPRGTKAAQLSQDRSEDEGLEERLFEELSTNFMVVERSDETEGMGETGDSE